MRANRSTLKLAAILALGLVSGCVDELDTGFEPPVEEGVETDLVADGDPLAYGIEEGVFDSIVHPVRGRIDLTISTTDPLLPNAGVELDIQGVAREQIDGGEVVLTLPTKALMDYVGEGRPDLPVKARWDLPAMGVGDTWSGTYTVSGAAAGYYRVMVNAYTHGPDGGPYLFDDEVRQAWMFISETDGQLTRFFEDTIFPEGVHPVAGPADGGMYSRPDSNETPWHSDSVYLAVVYSVSERDGFKSAAGASVYAWRRTGSTTWLEWRTVPEDSWDKGPDHPCVAGTCVAPLFLGRRPRVRARAAPQGARRHMVAFAQLRP